MTKDWVGNQNSIFKTLGASNHTDKERAVHDYYATEPFAIDVLCGAETFYGTVWEPACGGGHMSRRLSEMGYSVVSTDLVDRGFGRGGVDFLKAETALGDNIITNPPYKYALEFCEHALSLVGDGKKVAMFLKVQFLEGKKRKQFFIENPPKVVLISSSRLQCAKNGEFERMRAGGGSAVAFAWFIWEKGFKGPPILGWVN